MMELSHCLGKSWMIRQYSWSDESRVPSSAIAFPKTVLKCLGHLVRDKAIFVWSVEHWARASDEPFSLRELQQCDMPALATCWEVLLDTQLVFCIRPYAEMLLELVTADAPAPIKTKTKKEIAPFPHRCPRCGNPAYIGFSTIVCSIAVCNARGGF